MLAVFIILMVVWIVLVLGINLIVASKMTDIAIMKGHYKKTTSVFLFCFFFNVIGYIYLALLPDMVKRKNDEEILKAIKELKE